MNICIRFVNSLWPNKPQMMNSDDVAVFGHKAILIHHEGNKWHLYSEKDTDDDGGIATPIIIVMVGKLSGK